MKEICFDIEKALKNGAWRSALSLSLTLPDICGQVQYPNCRYKSEHYAKWFDQYVGKQYYTTKDELQVSVFNGQNCYALRNCFLHEGSSDVKVDFMNNFRLSIPCSLASNFGQMFSYSEVEQRVTINVPNLCCSISKAALEWYNRLDNNRKGILKKIAILEEEEFYVEVYVE